MPGERTSGKVRARFPNVNAGGSVKAALLNHPFRRDCAEPLSWALCPVLFGREPPPKELVRLTASVRGRGDPDWNVLMPLTPHPDTILPGKPVNPEINFWPLPRGRSRA